MTISTVASWSPASVVLSYRVAYGLTKNVSMTSTDGSTFSGVIPATAFTSGQLVRWMVSSSDGVVDPLKALKSEDPVWYGVIVPNATDEHELPVMELYCEDDNAPFSTGPESNNMSASGGKGWVHGCSASWNGRFYDGLKVRRRGSSSLSWVKPKIKVKSDNADMTFDEFSYTVDEFGLNSNWVEPGQNSYTREPLVWDVFNRMGVPAVSAWQLHLRFKGAYFGRYSFTESWSFKALAARGFDTTKEGRVLWKSNSGWQTNLRWDLPRDQIMYYYDLESASKDNATALDALLDLTSSLAGGGAYEGSSTASASNGESLSRSAYLFDRLNLPQVINHMAAQTVILNQDRCTKNFYVYREPGTKRWSILPWDVESGFGIDRGLNGTVATDYCILACEQWNSPLYCDHDHPQDIDSMTPTGLEGASPPPPLLASASNNPYLSAAMTSVEEAPTTTVAGSAATTGKRRLLSSLDDLLRGPGAAAARRAEDALYEGAASDAAFDPRAVARRMLEAGVTPEEAFGADVVRSARGADARGLSSSSASAVSAALGRGLKQLWSFSVGDDASASTPSPAAAPATVGSTIAGDASAAPAPAAADDSSADATSPAAAAASPAASPDTVSATASNSSSLDADGLSNEDIDSDFDADLTADGSTALDAASSYNWLYDAILSYPRTRAMYVRRLRSLMDQFVTTGVFEERVEYWTSLIRTEAIRDCEMWGNNAPPDYGRESLLTEQLPIRKQQLFETYAVGGTTPLIPDSYTSTSGITIASISQEASGVVEIASTAEQALDMSYFTLEGVVAYSFPPGTVLPAGESLYVVGDVATFLQTNAGQHFFSIGPLSVSSGSGLTLYDASHNAVTSA